MTTWRIEKLVPGGDGMARLPDGRIAFVSGALPGDVLSPTRTVSKKGYARAETWTLVEPSSVRVEPPCPIASRCGGCDWMALERTSQLRHKEAILRDALERVGHLRELPEQIPITSVGPDLGYRSRVRFHVEADGRIGFFAKRSHDLVDVERCAVCRPEINRALTLLREMPRAILSRFSSVEIRSAGEGTVGIHLEPRSDGVVTAEVRAALGALPDGYAATFAGQRGAFTQINLDVNAALVAEVVEGAKTRGVRRFLDLFAGAGNFALPLLLAQMTGTAVERDEGAVQSARRAARDAGLSDAGFVADDVAHFLVTTAPAAPPLDLVLMDPPRRGAKEVLGDVVRLAPRHIAMCSCDPVTLARDLATLAVAGYRLRDLRAFDMFPHTHHLETLAWMERTESTGPHT